MAESTPLPDAREIAAAERFTRERRVLGKPKGSTCVLSDPLRGDSYVESREVEAEGLHLTQERADARGPGAFALVLDE